MRKTLLQSASGAIICASLVSFFPELADAAESCEPVVGRLVSVEGNVEVQRTGDSDWIRANLQDVLCQGDTVRAGQHSRAAVALINEAVLRIDQSTAVRLVDITDKEEERSFLSLLAGAFQSFSRKPREMEVDTPYLNGSIEGTEFVFRVEGDRTILTVLEGQVLAANDQGSISVASGESVAAEAGKAPEPRIVVRPRDAVQWSLYYPPILAFLGGASGRVPADAPAYLRSSMQMAADGDIGGAFTELEGVAEANRDASFYLFRATLGLSVGRVDEAGPDIQQSLRLDPDAGLAYSLRAIIEIIQNENEAALASAIRGVELSETAAAKIALSYAQQANFQIETARDTLQHAVEQHPEDPLAWARLGELWLMLGNSRESRAAAQKATELAPNLARTQLVLGFAALAEFRNADALAAFERAIELSSADPLAHLGLGLAKISSGKLEQGTGDLEVAVALDSNNSLLRAYLGKAYFEERRYPLDSEQYSIAKQLDPNDPTAYLYDGILKQTVNRPIEAVEDLERSIELNDNRAVYRSRLLLDKDRAARGTSLARAYKDLGFNQLGVNQSTESLTLDPSNASAHRFLSDTYLGVRRLEISRVSELLQAQLMQDININPVQPSVAATNLNIVTLGGPASPGFNEFTPLFQRNKSQFNVTGFGGNNDTYGGEGVLSGLYDRFSYSVGGFTSNTDGWRPNNGLDQDLYNVYLQGAVTPEVNLQAEFQHQESTAGDLAFNFDPDDFLLDRTTDRDQDTARIGLRISPMPRSPQSTILLSYIHNDREEIQRLSEPLDPFTTISFDADIRDKGDQWEAQYIYQRERLNFLVGAAYSDADSLTMEEIVISDIDLGPVETFGGTFDEKIEHPRGYVYANIHTGEESIDWTIGASYDDFQQGILEETSFNPKFGVQWGVNDKIRLRAAAFKVVKPLIVNNRTIEPTQVAGFNQFFDDINGTESWRYGLGLDFDASSDISFGGELTKRDMDEPVFRLFNDPPDTVFEDREEKLHRLYLYWTPSDRWGVTAEFVYDQYEAEEGLITEFADLPEKITTLSLPIGVNYFHQSGFFAGVVGTYVDQDVRRSPNTIRAQGEDSFFVVDVGVGYRFPKRRGVASLGVRNLFDEKFNYQDDSFREFRGESSTGPYFADRIIIGQVSLSF
ncbi:MAG: FecR domain-containing protein [Gammaproteobacteria bacterium]|nr:FecR domain-containing protein [Gammaproteobacteria bacterium]